MGTACVRTRAPDVRRERMNEPRRRANNERLAKTARHAKLLNYVVSLILTKC
jgi:hypothetical protein